MSDDNNKNIKPVVAGTAINSVVKQAVGINPANVINSYSPIKQVNHVNQKPQIINGQTVPGKLPIKQPMETKVPPTQDDDSCVICLDNPQDAVLYKCGHPMCYDCALNQWKAPTGGTCPICRATIVDVMRVFKV